MHWVPRILRRTTVSLSKDPGMQAARNAAREAESARQRSVEDSGEINILSDELRKLRETNHFAELIRTAIRNERHPG